ncbi:hypothetical protein GCM10007387_58650 [Pseudoduganella albidiflava]|nr:hypothetical protein GCM10007387_58650 [Pseudoduganella albidiflava]
MRNLATALALLTLSASALAAGTPKYKVVILSITDWYTAAIGNNGTVLLSQSNWNDSRPIVTDGVQQTMLGTLGGHATYGHDINSSNTVVGRSQDASNQLRAFIWKDNVMRAIGGARSIATGINDAGTVIGHLGTGERSQRGFVYTEAGGMVVIGTLGGEGSAVTAIHEDGRVLGKAQDIAGTWKNFVYENGAMTVIDTDLALTGFAPDGGYYGVRLSGTVAHTEAIVFRDGVVETSYRLSAITDMNATGLATGLDHRTNQVGMLGFPDGSAYSIEQLVDDPRWWVGWSALSGINDAGQIIGTGCVVTTGCYAIRLDPLAAVPEPATWTMLAAGLAFIGWKSGRRPGRQPA